MPDDLDAILGGALAQVDEGLHNRKGADSERSLRRQAAALIKGRSELVKASLEFAPGFHKELKIYSVLADKTMREVVETAVREYMDKHPINQKPPW